MGLRRLVMALVALALLLLPAMPVPGTAQASPVAAAPATAVAITDCAGHHAMPASRPDQGMPQPPDSRHGSCCLAGQCPMLAALPPPVPLALAGPVAGPRGEAGVGAEPPGILRGPPRPPPRARG